MKRLCLLLGLWFLTACSAPTGPVVASVNSAGLTLHRAQAPRAIPWSDIDGMSVTGHLVSEEKSAPVLVISEKGQSVEVCSGYPHRVDPKSYAGTHNAISVNKESFTKLRDTIASGAGLQPNPDTEGQWLKTGTPAPVTEAEFTHGFTGPTD